MKIFSWGDVERETAVSKHRIKYAVQRRRLGNFMKVNGAFVFTDADVERIREHFAGLEPWQRINSNEIKGETKAGEQ